MHEPGENLDGSYILSEHDGELAIVLWTAVNDVTLWASVVRERRDGMFWSTSYEERIATIQACGASPELELALTALTSVVQKPSTASENGISSLCIALSNWAADRGALGTAVAFAQAAALAWPQDAVAATVVGRHALAWGRFTRAETWLRRAVSLARRGQEWHAYAEAHVGLGDLYRVTQQPERSHTHFRRAIRAACRGVGKAVAPERHNQVRGGALHGLFLLAMQAGDLDKAAKFSALANRAHGRGNPRSPALLHDTAELYVAMKSYGVALSRLQRLLPDRHALPARAFTLALIAHAAAGAEQPTLYEESWSSAWSFLDGLDGAEGTTRTLLELARAAALRTDWLRVSVTAKRVVADLRSARDPRVTDEIAELVGRGTAANATDKKVAETSAGGARHLGNYQGR